MENRRPSELSLPYGRVAKWGIVASVVATGVFLLAAPWSPVRLAARALDAAPEVRAVLPRGVGALPTAAEVGRHAVKEVLGQEGRVDHRRVHDHEWLRVAPELGIELSREWGALFPELGAELSREWGRVLPELSAELSRGWTTTAPELRREMRRELRGLRVEIAPSWPAVVVGGG